MYVGNAVVFTFEGSEVNLWYLHCMEKKQKVRLYSWPLCL